MRYRIVHHRRDIHGIELDYCIVQTLKRTFLFEFWLDHFEGKHFRDEVDAERAIKEEREGQLVFGSEVLREL